MKCEDCLIGSKLFQHFFLNLSVHIFSVGQEQHVKSRGLVKEEYLLIIDTAARIITWTSRYEHITPVLKELHWIPVNHRVEFKVLMLTYKALNDQSPSYIRDMLQIYHPARSLR